jgi:hypothetical protein
MGSSRGVKPFLHISPSPLKERDKKESPREAKPLLNKPSPFPFSRGSRTNKERGFRLRYFPLIQDLLRNGSLYFDTVWKNKHPDIEKL